jgi:hypothetical protein
MKRAALLAALAWMPVVAAFAQSPESENPEGALAQPGDVTQVVPDVPSGLNLDALQINTESLTLKPGLAVLGDYTAFTQNAASIEQVGEQVTLTAAPSGEGSSTSGSRASTGSRHGVGSSASGTATPTSTGSASRTDARTSTCHASSGSSESPASGRGT